MKLVKDHALHVAMCVPMLIIGGILLATGSTIFVLVPVVGCVLMMALMMGAMAGLMQRR